MEQAASRRIGPQHTLAHAVPEGRFTDGRLRIAHQRRLARQHGGREPGHHGARPLPHLVRRHAGLVQVAADAKGARPGGGQFRAAQRVHAADTDQLHVARQHAAQRCQVARAAGGREHLEVAGARRHRGEGLARGQETGCRHHAMRNRGADDLRIRIRRHAQGRAAGRQPGDLVDGDHGSAAQDHALAKMRDQGADGVERLGRIQGNLGHPDTGRIQGFGDADGLAGPDAAQDGDHRHLGQGGVQPRQRLCVRAHRVAARCSAPKPIRQARRESTKVLRTPRRSRAAA